MAVYAHSDLISAALNALRDAALAPHDAHDLPTFDGVLRRYRVEGDKAGSKNGWAVWYGDGIPSGAYGSWKTGQADTWCAKSDSELTAEERAQRDQSLASAQRARAAAQQQVHADTRVRAADLWSKSRDTVAANHPYLLKKGIPAIGVRQLQDMIVVPVQDAQGGFHSLQFIGADGTKRFLTGGALRGHFALLGDLKGEARILICEGYATGVTLYQALGWPVVVAFNAGNLAEAGRAIRGAIPDAELIFCGDDDQWTPGNPGRTKALAAAQSLRGVAVFPDFTGLDVTEKPTDFNDWMRLIGLDAVQRRWPELWAAAIHAPPPSSPPPDRPPEERASWEAGLTRTGKGEVVTSAGNIELILRNHPQWAGLLAYDEMSYRTIKRRAPPYPGGQPGEWSDADDIWTAIWLERQYGLRPRSTTVGQVVAASAMLQRFHQVRDWLAALPPWDGLDRLSRFFVDACGAPLSPYTQAVGRAFFVAAVARVEQPGCKVDTMLVLEGPQGVGKSKLILELFSLPWHIEISYAPGSLDFFQSLRGCWCAEFGELSQFDRADTNRIKQTLTQVQDTYRASYGHHSGTYPRQVVFVGSTNKREWGFDETGLRRFLPIYCADINIDYVRECREQLWAEALQRFRNGETWWTIPDAEKEQEARYDYDAWEEKVVNWIDRQEQMQSRMASPAPLMFTINTVYESAIHSESARLIPPMTRGDQTRIGKVLTRLGWQRRREMVSGKRQYLYERAPS